MSDRDKQLYIYIYRQVYLIQYKYWGWDFIKKNLVRLKSYSDTELIGPNNHPHSRYTTFAPLNILEVKKSSPLNFCLQLAWLYWRVQNFWDGEAAGVIEIMGAALLATFSPLVVFLVRVWSTWVCYLLTFLHRTSMFEKSVCGLGEDQRPNTIIIHV